MSFRLPSRKPHPGLMQAISRAIASGLLLAMSSVLWAGPSEMPHGTRKETRQILVKVREPLAKVLEAGLPDQGKEIHLENLLGDQARPFLVKHSVKKIQPLYPGLIHLRRKMGWSDAQIADHVRQLFPERTRRLSLPHSTPDISRTYVLEVGEGASETVQSIINRLKADPNVDYAEPNRVVSTSSLPNDPFLSSSGSWGQPYADLWGLSAINAPAAWNTSAGDGVVVAVIDTGVDYTHADIVGNMWANAKEIAGNGIDDDGNGYIDDIRGWDFVGTDCGNPVQSNNPIDHHGHGTHAAGIIAATGNNSIGIIGVAWKAKIMALKGLDDTGSGLDTTLAPAIIYAAKNGADVINASWGGPGNSRTIEEAIQFAYSVGVPFIAAAGNSGADAWDYYPANAPEAITVAASGPSCCYSWISWSNYGTKIDVAAPGVDILSLRATGANLGSVVGDSYMRLDGTSMAAPHVAGLVALMLSRQPDYPIENLRQTLRASANSTFGGWHPTQGPGIIDAQKALAFTGALQVHFTAPAGQTRITGPVTLQGTVQGTGFDHYVLEYGAGPSPTAWHQLQTSSVPVTTGVLGVFDPGALPDGAYTIRLTVFDAQGRTFSDRLGLLVAFISITSPSNPAVPVTALQFKSGAQVPVMGMASGPAFKAYRIEWARGIYPVSGWSAAGVTLPSGGASPVASGTLGTWDTSGITPAGYHTIRVSVDNLLCTSSAVTLVYLEPDLLSQHWPQALDQGNSKYRGLIPMMDVSGNISLGLVTPTTLFSPSSQFLKFASDGVLQNSFGFTGGGSNNNLAAGDVAGSGSQDPVFTAQNNALTIFGQGNSFLALQPKPADRNINYWTGTPTLASLEGKGPLDIVALGCDRSSGTASLYVWRGDGSMPYPNLPNAIPDQHVAIRYGWDGTPRVLVGDVNGDGFKEFVVVEGLSSSTYTLGLFALDGTPIPWSVPVFSGQPTALALADLDHNGKLETILIDSWNTIHVFQPDGSERAGWPQMLGVATWEGALAIGDLAHNGHEQIVVSTARKILLFNPDGTTYSNTWPLSLTDQCSTPVVLADVDGDGTQEIIVTQQSVEWVPTALQSSLSSEPALPSFLTESTSPAGNGPGDRWDRHVSINAGGSWFNGNYYASPYVAAYRLDGSIARTWKLFGAVGNQPSFSALLAVGDFNRDGLTDIAITYPTIEGGGISGWLMHGVATAISTGAPFNAAQNDWPMINRDAQNSSVLARVQITPPQPVVTGMAPGSALPGDTITLTGTSLRFTTSVKFNGTPTTFTVTSDASIATVVPIGATSGPVSVTTPGGTGTSVSSLTILAPLKITSFSPTSGPIGTSVTLYGANFTGATAVKFNGTSAAFTVTSDTTLTTTVPASATSGTISVAIPGGAAVSAAIFTVTSTPTVTVSVSPKSVTMLAGGQVGFTANVLGSTNTAVSWAITSGGGSLSGGASAATTYTAPAFPGIATITATSQADGAKTDSATITIKSRDFNGDGITDVLDIAMIARAFGSTPSNPYWNPAADLNGDGVVDDTDLNLFLAGM